MGKGFTVGPAQSCRRSARGKPGASSKRPLFRDHPAAPGKAGEPLAILRAVTWRVRRKRDRRGLEKRVQWRWIAAVLKQVSRDAVERTGHGRPIRAEIKKIASGLGRFPHSAPGGPYSPGLGGQEPPQRPTQDRARRRRGPSRMSNEARSRRPTRGTASGEAGGEVGISKGRRHVPDDSSVIIFYRTPAFEPIARKLPQKVPPVPL